MIAECPGFRGRARRQDMGVECGKQSALIDEIVAGVPDQSDAIEHQAADEFGGDDDCVQSEARCRLIGDGYMWCSCHTSVSHERVAAASFAEQGH